MRRGLYWRLFAVFIILGMVIGAILVAQSMIGTARVQAFCRENSQAVYASDCKELAGLNEKYKFASRKSETADPAAFCASEKATGRFNGSCEYISQFREDFQAKYNITDSSKPAAEQANQDKPKGRVALIFAGAIVGVLFAWMGWAVTAKRLHDRNLSGWWQIVPMGINIVSSVSAHASPIIGGLFAVIAGIGSLAIFIICGFLKGTTGDNRFGPDPLNERVTLK